MQAKHQGPCNMIEKSEKYNNYLLSIPGRGRKIKLMHVNLLVAVTADDVEEVLEQTMSNVHENFSLDKAKIYLSNSEVLRDIEANSLTW